MLKRFLESRGLGFGLSGKDDGSQQRGELMYGKGGEDDGSQQRGELMYGKGGKDDGSQQHGKHMHGGPKGGADTGGIYPNLTEHPQSFSENKCISSESVFGEIDWGRIAH
jgi:hypothetical protein